MNLDALLEGIPVPDDLLGTEYYQILIDFYYNNFTPRCNFTGNSCATRPNSKCCCGFCAEQRGWLDFKKLPEELVDLFHEEDGFWRINQGCILPRSWRSVGCNFYICQGLSVTFTTEELRWYKKVVDQLAPRLSLKGGNFKSWLSRPIRWAEQTPIIDYY